MDEQGLNILRGQLDRRPREDPSNHGGIGGTSTQLVSMKLWGEIKGKKVVVLVDYGASNNLIAKGMVRELDLPVSETQEYVVEVEMGIELNVKECAKG